MRQRLPEVSAQLLLLSAAMTVGCVCLAHSLQAPALCCECVIKFVIVLLENLSHCALFARLAFHQLCL